jgi:hypothetical protein
MRPDPTRTPAARTPDALGPARRICPASGYVVIVLANLDPPVAQRVADYLDARLPLDE